MGGMPKCDLVVPRTKDVEGSGEKDQGCLDDGRSASGEHWGFNHWSAYGMEKGGGGRRGEGEGRDGVEEFEEFETNQVKVDYFRLTR